MPTTATIEHLNSYWRAKLGLVPDAPQGLPSYFDLTLTGNPYYAGLGWLDAWCLNPNLVIASSNSTHNATLYSSTELNLLPAGLFGSPAHDALAIGNLDLVNWIVNQNYTANPQFNYGEVQAAMWKLLGYGEILDGGDLTQDGPVLLSDVNIIYNAALTHDGFVPDSNQKISIVVDVGGGQQPIIIDVLAAKLGDFVWHDLNENGAQDGGEAGIEGAAVNLVRDLNIDGDFSDANEILATTTTDATGYYEFKGLTPGLTYQVQFITPTGFDFVSPRQAPAVPAASNSDGLVSDVVILAPGEFNATIDSGFYKQKPPEPASLGDFVWHDNDADGIQEAGEAGIAGVTVTLLADEDNDTQIDDVVGTQLTDTSGFYKFSGLTPGKQYQVEFTNPDSAGPDAYTFSPRQAGSNPALDSDGALSDTVVLSPGEHNPTIDAGLYRKGSIHVFGFLDSDGDGTLDTSESAFPSNPGKRIELLNAQNTVIASDVTDANGQAGFEGLDPGTYTVRESPVPTGYVLTSPSSVTVTIGSGEEHVYKNGAAQLPPGDGRTEVLDTDLVFGNAPIGIDIEKLVRGRYEDKSKCDWDKLPQDFWKCYSFNELFYKVKSLFENCDYDWFKAFCDKFENFQSCIEFIKSFLEKFHDSNGTIVETADFDADSPTGPEIPVGGEAIFTYLVKNTGAVELSNVTVTDDRIPTLTFVSGDTDNDGKLDTSEVWKYTAKESVLTNQQYVNVATVTGEAGGNTVTDSDAAHYIGKAETLKAKIGDRVWCDKDMDGVQDAGESGIGGVTVKLKNASGTVVQTTTTDYHGEYLFEVAPGTYSVQFVKPNGYTFTGTDKGSNDALDSDANSSGMTANFTLASGEQKLTIDAGLYVPGPKFFVVDTTCDEVYKYSSSGGGMGNFNLRSGNDSPTGIAANVDGSKLWVLDCDKNIYVHNSNGSTAGQWKAGDLGSSPEGITVWGQDAWIVDSATDKIYWYDNGATFTAGTHYANKTFSLSSSISNAKGIVTDGDRLWLVNDSSGTDKVFVFDIGGTSSNPTLTALGSWSLASGNSKPTGVTIDPTGSSNSIWVVDTGTDKVYEYANAKGLTSGSGGTPKTFNLADGNCNPTDIADPLSLIGQASALESNALFA